MISSRAGMGKIAAGKCVRIDLNWIFWRALNNTLKTADSFCRHDEASEVQEVIILVAQEVNAKSQEVGVGEQVESQKKGKQWVQERDQWTLNKGNGHGNWENLWIIPEILKGKKQKK